MRSIFMSFIFYDTETTGLDTTFDQILQFAAILTDDEFDELERFETRCQLPAIRTLADRGTTHV